MATCGIGLKFPSSVVRHIPIEFLMKALGVLLILHSSMNHDIIMREALSDRLTLINPGAAQFG